MKKIVFSCAIIITCIVSNQAYAQSLDNASLYTSAVKNIQTTMPSKVTIDGKRIYSVDSDHICSITVTMTSYNKYQFSLMTWPGKGHVDDAGYTEFILKDTDNKPHILRTDQIKGRKFLTNMNKLIKNCQESSKTNKITSS